MGKSFFFSNNVYTMNVTKSLLFIGLMLLSSTRQLHFKLGAAIVRAAHWKTSGQLCAFNFLFFKFFFSSADWIPTIDSCCHCRLVSFNCHRIEQLPFFPISSVNFTPNTLCSMAARTHIAYGAWKLKNRKEKLEREKHNFQRWQKVNRNENYLNCSNSWRISNSSTNCFVAFRTDFRRCCSNDL